jgi:Pyruvate/2-oxoacid:ferredoxin oxidoreductase delta subunit
VTAPIFDPTRLKLNLLRRQAAPDAAAHLHRHPPGRPWSEVALDHDAAAILAEASRCYSCGDCSGCERCWMYCTPGCMKRSTDRRPGHYFEINLDLCDGCRKCAEECPCGFLEMA